MQLKNNLFKLDDSVKNYKLEGNNTYSKKVEPPQYIPSEVKPQLSSVYNLDKYIKLLKDIDNAVDITEEERTFLKLAASRHIEYNYSLIADYYAHSNKEVQKLMEDSALVIIDFDNAIANGYVEFSSRIYSLLQEEMQEKVGKNANKK